MGNIAVMELEGGDGRWFSAVKRVECQIFGVPALCLRVLHGSRCLRTVPRILKREQISALAVRGPFPEGLLERLRACNCTLYDGKRLLYRLYPRILHDLAKTRGLCIEQAVFAVYADTLDTDVRQMVLDTAAQARFVTLITPDPDADVFSEHVLEQTGLALVRADGGIQADIALVAGKEYQPGTFTINFSSMQIPGAIGNLTLAIPGFPAVGLAEAEAVFTEYPVLWKQYERTVKIIAFC